MERINQPRVPRVRDWQDSWRNELSGSQQVYVQDVELPDDDGGKPRAYVFEVETGWLCVIKYADKTKKTFGPYVTKELAMEIADNNLNLEHSQRWQRV